MPTPRLDVSLSLAIHQLDRLIGYVNTANNLPPSHQYLIAEIIMLRSFSILDAVAEEIACKLVCGAVYLNGSSPVLNCQARNMVGSVTLLKSHGRQKPVQFLKFTNAHYLKDSVKRIIPETDPYVKNALSHSGIYDEMRKVRNFIAHKSTRSRNDYKAVIRQLHGVDIKLQLGPFLMSTSRQKPANLYRYLLSTKVILQDMVKG